MLKKTFDTRREKVVLSVFGPVMTMMAGRRDKKLKLKRNIQEYITADRIKPIIDLLFKWWQL